MWIKHVSLKNWKNFKAADFKVRDRLFIIGPNAVGKSNLLDLFRFLNDVATNGLRDACQKRGGVSAIRCLGAKQYSDIEIKITLTDGDDEWIYELVIVQDNLRQPTVKHEGIVLNKQNIFSRPDRDDEKDKIRLRQTALEQYSLNAKFRKVNDFFRTISYQHIIPQAVKDPMGFSPGPLNDDPFGRDFIIRIWKTNEKVRSSRLKKITEALKGVVPQLSYLEAQQDETGRPHLKAGWKNWRKTAAGQREDQLSDGTLRLLGLLWACFEGSGPLLLEEPELSLNPEVVKLIPALLSKVNSSRKEPRQYFISTHSYELLSDRGIRPADIIRLEPGDHGTHVFETSSPDAKAMTEGRLTAADVLLPKTRPRNPEQLVLVFK